MKEEDVLKEAHEIDHEIHHLEEKANKKGPAVFILGLVLMLMIITMVVPFYNIKANPSPSYIPSVSEVVGDLNYTEHSTSISLDMIDGVGVKEVADKIALLACSSGNRICYAKAMYYFVRDNFVYVNDPSAYEYVKTARQSLVSGNGDCDDASVLLSSLLSAVGINSRFVFVPGHVFVQANLPSAINRYKVDGDYVNLDATCSNCEFGELTYSVVSAEKRYLG